MVDDLGSPAALRAAAFSCGAINQVSRELLTERLSGPSNFVLSADEMAAIPVVDHHTQLTTSVAGLSYPPQLTLVEVQTKLFQL